MEQCGVVFIEGYQNIRSAKIAHKQKKCHHEEDDTDDTKFSFLTKGQIWISRRRDPLLCLLQVLVGSIVILDHDFGIEMYRERGAKIKKRKECRFSLLIAPERTRLSGRHWVGSNHVKKDEISYIELDVQGRTFLLQFSLSR